MIFDSVFRVGERVRALLSQFPSPLSCPGRLATSLYSAVTGERERERGGEGGREGGREREREIDTGLCTVYQYYIICTYQSQRDRH